jgi:tripartite-type tricarboxylate transporter receptor subunit TctC
MTGKLYALAVTAPTRITALKDVPSVVEEGFPDLVTADRIGLGVFEQQIYKGAT